MQVGHVVGVMLLVMIEDHCRKKVDPEHKGKKILIPYILGMSQIGRIILTTFFLSLRMTDILRLKGCQSLLYTITAQVLNLCASIGIRLLRKMDLIEYDI